MAKRSALMPALCATSARQQATSRRHRALPGSCRCDAAPAKENPAHAVTAAVNRIKRRRLQCASAN